MNINNVYVRKQCRYDHISHGEVILSGLNTIDRWVSDSQTPRCCRCFVTCNKMGNHVSVKAACGTRIGWKHVALHHMKHVAPHHIKHVAICEMKHGMCHHCGNFTYVTTALLHISMPPMVMLHTISAEVPEYHWLTI